MSRSDYCYDLDNWDMIKWRGQVASAIRGQRGQKLLRDMLLALDALPEKTLVAEELRTEQGEVCALGALGLMRGIDMERLDPEDPDRVAGAFDVAPQLVREIAHLNDDYSNETPEARFARMRRWVESQIKPATGSPLAAS